MITFDRSLDQACLVQCDWDMEKAFDALRKKGLAAAAKKSARHASEGLVGLASSASAGARGPAVAIVEINSETDFVSRGDLFRGLVTQVGCLSWIDSYACLAVGNRIIPYLLGLL